MSEYRDELPSGVAAALASAEIPPSKLGPARHARLSNAERELYFWILHRFASRGGPVKAEMREQARRSGVDFERALEALSREDLVHRDGDGGISVAYPFSGRATAHTVRFQSGREAYAMCAIDALGIASMFDQTIEISSHDPLAGDELRGRLAPDGRGAWQPDSTAVVAGVIDRDGEAFRGCCPVLNFFASPANAERWLEEHPEVQGQVVSMEDAILAGRAIFGGVFDEAPDTADDAVR